MEVPMDYTESGSTQNQMTSGRDQKQPPTQNPAPNTQNNTPPPEDIEMLNLQGLSVDLSVITQQPSRIQIQSPDQTEQNQDQKGTPDLGGFNREVLSAAQISSSLSDDASKATDVEEKDHPSIGASPDLDMYTSGDHASAASDTPQDLYTSGDQTGVSADSGTAGAHQMIMSSLNLSDFYTAKKKLKNPTNAGDAPEGISSITLKDLNRSVEDTQNPPPAAAHVTKTSSSASKSSDTKQKKHSNYQKKEATDNSEPQPSAPRDIKKFYIKVDWTGELPKRWRPELQKALQTWCSQQPPEDKWSINKLHLLDNERIAEVEISPSTALKGIKTADLTFKQFHKKATIHFYDDEPKSNNDFIPKGSFPKDDTTDKETTHSEVMKNEEAASLFQDHTEMTEASNAFTLSQFKYWYLSQAYEKEVEQIENNFGVCIKAEASVVISAEENKKAESDSIRRAAQAFSDLVQKATQNLKTANIPQTHMESDIMKEVLRNIPTQVNKLMLNMSANNYLLSGPEKMISAVEKRLNLDPGVEPAKWTPKNLDMDIKDTQAPVEMDETHFNIMNNTFEKQLLEIQHKYGVQFDSVPVQGMMKVSVRSSGTHQLNLEAFALRALTHLYQKVVTSVVTCDLKDVSHTQKVSEAFKRIQSQHDSVSGGERNGSWQLFGLPRHLIPAITHIEKITGHPVFDDKTKQLLGYRSDLPQTGGFQRAQMGMDVMGGAHGTNLRGATEAKNFHFSQDSSKIENGKEKQYEDNCPICLDIFTEKRKLKCGHEFCEECLQHSVKSSGEICPVCKKIFGILKGNQPDGHMDIRYSKNSLPGFPGYGMIEIIYDIPHGVQTSEHPNPGKPYHGTHRTAYLPDNDEGKHVLTLLKRAFNQKLIFTVGFSRTTGAEDVVTWNDIHHKTTTRGGAEGFGYPDPHYLDRVKEELKAKGIE